MENTVYSRFRHWAEIEPDAVAIIDDRRKVTYSQLDVRSAAVAEALGDLSGRRVGIVMSHGADQIAAMLGVLRSGNAYVPAEPSLPQDRIDYYMQSAGVAAIITSQWMRNLKPAKGPYPEDKSTPQGLAYILFTSGTSGKPKGVMIENHSVVNYAHAFKTEMGTIPDDVMLQLSVCSFDIFVEEVFATLLNGAALAIPPAKVVAGDVKGLMEYCDRVGVTEISGFPYLLAEMNRLPKLPSKLRLLISGGDVLRASYITNLIHPLINSSTHQPIRIYNTYGPSEACVCATYARVDNIEPLADGTYPIGHPIAGVEVLLLDKDLNPVAPGSKGEIVILGDGVGRGYLGNPPESRNYTTLPDGRRAYRSGDLGYLLPDGEFGFLHRIDDQVMIFGKRVEPAEVENVLNSAPGVERGVVRSFLDPHGLAYLVAYFVPKGSAASLKKLKKWLASKLSDFMVPEIFVAMKSIPLTRRGKVDNTALPKVLKDD